MNGPDTRPSLLLQLRDPAQHAAWEEFVLLYQPLVYRLARRKGLQHADASDLCQDVLAAVGQSIQRFDPDPKKGSFRGWLNRIARNHIINRLTRDRSIRGTGDTQVMHMLAEQPLTDGALEAELALEYRRELFRLAAHRVKQDVTASTWDAFWMSAVKGISIEETARQLGKSAGAVRVSRCRVLARIRGVVRQLEVSQEATP